MSEADKIIQRHWPQSVDKDDDTDDETNSDDAMLGRVMRRSELAGLPPLTALVTGLLDYPTAGVLVGPYGVGKTFLGLSLACCVATGRKWLGRDVERRRVLLVVGEGGSGLDARIAAWEQSYNNGQPVSDDDLIVDVQPSSLANVAVWRRITEQCEQHDIGFVVLDTFSSLAPDADETKDAARVLRYMHNIASRIGGCVMLVHHPGWGDSERTRGGYQFEANADYVLLIKGSPDVPVMQLVRKKVKDGAGGQSMFLSRQVVELYGDRIGQRSVVISQVEPSAADVPLWERIALVLDGCGDVGATGPQIKAELGVDDSQRSAFYRALRKAVDDERVRVTGEGNARRYYLDDTS